jgi:putative ABC transport system permease protein
MSVVNRGVRNAFRNRIRTLSIVLILSLSIGLSLVMLIAHQAVGQKINDVKASVGNTINIQPAGFNPLSQANNALTTDNLSKIKSISHVTNLTETLTDRLTTVGSSQPQSPFGNSSSNSNNQTSLTSPVTLNSNGNGSFSSGNGGAQLFISGGGGLPANFSPPIQILGTSDPSRLPNSTNVTIKSGKLIDGSKDTNDAMVSTDMATKNNLKVGSTFTAYGATLTVAGIFNSGTQGGNDIVVVSLPALQRLSGQGNVVNDATATVDSADNLSSTVTAVKNKLGTNADVTSSLDEANNTIKPLQNVQNISLISLIGAMIAGAIIILLTMIMIVRERRREIGILKAIGASNFKVIFQFMSEALTFTILAAAIGLVIGVAGGGPVTNTLVTNSSNSASSNNSAGPGTFSRSVAGGGGVTLARPGGGFVNRSVGGFKNTLSNINTNIGWNILAYGLGVAALIAIVGSGSAGWLIAKVRPAEVMRSE